MFVKFCSIYFDNRECQESNRNFMFDACVAHDKQLKFQEVSAPLGSFPVESDIVNSRLRATWSVLTVNQIF